MASRRRKCAINNRNINNENNFIKTIELMRTNNGYGFTLSGEMPCMLTQVKGQARASGLSSGDFLLSVNGQNVSHRSHDTVVLLITNSINSLVLKVEKNNNYYSTNSDSSDSDPRQSMNERQKRSTNRSRNRSLNTNVKQNNLISYQTSQHMHKHNRAYDQRNRRSEPQMTHSYRSNEPLLDLLLEQRLDSIEAHNQTLTQLNFHEKKSSIDRKVQKSNPTGDEFDVNSPKLFTEEDMNEILYPSLERITLNANESRSDISEDLHSRALLRAVVGYLGTIEMPKDSNIDPIIIKNCIRRIRVENKLHTTVLFAVYPESIILANIDGQSIAEFLAENILSCGICAEDQKCFGLITSNTNQSNEQNSIQSESQNSSYSCHVFTSTPSPHQIHYLTANKFAIKCTLDPVTNNCLEFPESSDSILRVIVGLYRNRFGCAPIALSNVNITHSSSNSDSGIHDSHTSIGDIISQNSKSNLNTSFNTQQLEAQLNAVNMRQTFQKYFHSKHETNAAKQPSSLYSHFNPEQSSHDSTQIECNIDRLHDYINLTDRSVHCSANNINDSSINIFNNNNSNVKNQANSEGTDSCPSTKADNQTDIDSIFFDPKMIHTTSATKSWVRPATLCKENLELNNEITSGYDCETKTSMSLEGMAPMSDSVSASASVVSERPIDVGWVGGWAQDFEKLLSDNVGLNVFAEFLKKEFSYENLQFWISCQEFKKLNNQLEMKESAKALFERHLCIGAVEPVNVDSHARQVAQKGLNDPTNQLFSLAEKQIYNLMKFDCYQRFLKSDIYKECVTLELQGRPLPFEYLNETKINDQNNDKHNETQSNKPKKRSLIPWHRSKQNKMHDKNMSKIKANTKDMIMKKLSNSMPKISTNSNQYSDQISSCSANRSDMTGSQSSITSSEPVDKQSQVFVLSKSRESINDSNLYHISGHCKRENCRLSRITFPDRSQTCVPITPGLTIGQTIHKLLEKRNLHYSAFDAFITGSDSPLDLTSDMSTVGCSEIRVEQRVLFQLDFPNKEIIGIKARASKLCGDVFRPLLTKYGYKFDHIILHIANSSKCVNPKMPITVIDNQRVIVSVKDDLEEWGWDVNNSRIPVAVDKSRIGSDSLLNSRLSDDSHINQTISESLSQSDDSPGKENRLPSIKSLVTDLGLKHNRNDCNNYYSESVDMSFGDDTKSEQFFRDLMLSSQHIPISKNSFSLSPKPIAQKRDSLKTVANTNSSLTKQTNNLMKYNQEIKFSKCHLSPIERINTTVINDIDLDETLKSMQFNDKLNANSLETTLTPSKILYPSQKSLNNSLIDINVADYTPPTPIASIDIQNAQKVSYIQTMPQTSVNKTPIRRLLSDPPPLPPKASQRDRGPPPRPPISKHFQSVNDSDNDFINNFDKTIESNISFV